MSNWLSNLGSWICKFWLLIAVIAVFIFILRMSDRGHPAHAVWKSKDTVEIEGKLYHVEPIDNEAE